MKNLIIEAFELLTEPITEFAKILREFWEDD